MGRQALRINPNLDEALQEIAAQMKRVENKIYAYIEDEVPSILSAIPGGAIKHDVPGKHDPQHTLRVSKMYEKVLSDRNTAKKLGYREIKVVKAGIVFTTRSLESLGDKLEDLQERYNEATRQFLCRPLRALNIHSRSGVRSFHNHKTGCLH